MYKYAYTPGLQLQSYEMPCGGSFLPRRRRIGGVEELLFKGHLSVNVIMGDVIMGVVSRMLIGIRAGSKIVCVCYMLYVFSKDLDNCLLVWSLMKRSLSNFCGCGLHCSWWYTPCSWLDQKRTQMPKVAAVTEGPLGGYLGLL